MRETGDFCVPDDNEVAAVLMIRMIAIDILKNIVIVIMMTI